MVLDPGAMRSRILIQQSYIDTNPDTGWQEEMYRDYRHLWARVVYQSGREFREGGLASGETRATFSIRYRTDITSADRLIFDGLIWDIQSVVPVGYKVGVDINARTTGNEYDPD